MIGTDQYDVINYSQCVFVMLKIIRWFQYIEVCELDLIICLSRPPVFPFLPILCPGRPASCPPISSRYRRTWGQNIFVPYFLPARSSWIGCFLQNEDEFLLKAAYSIALSTCGFQKPFFPLVLSGPEAIKEPLLLGQGFSTILCGSPVCPTAL